jgi:hypothetical protein
VVTLEKLPEVIPNAAKQELTHLHASQQFGEAFEIRDLGSHTPATVTTLALLLAGAVDVRPDPKRKNFYEVVDSSQTYYIHVSQVSGIIYLLAVWQKCRRTVQGSSCEWRSNHVS